VSRLRLLSDTDDPKLTTCQRMANGKPCGEPADEVPVVQAWVNEARDHEPLSVFFFRLYTCKQHQKVMTLQELDNGMLEKLMLEMCKRSSVLPIDYKTARLVFKVPPPGSPM